MRAYDRGPFFQKSFRLGPEGYWGWGEGTRRGKERRRRAFEAEAGSGGLPLDQQNASVAAVLGGWGGKRGKRGPLSRRAAETLKQRRAMTKFGFVDHFNIP